MFSSHVQAILFLNSSLSIFRVALISDFFGIIDCVGNVHCIRNKDASGVVKTIATPNRIFVVTHGRLLNCYNRNAAIIFIQVWTATVC